MSNKKSLLIKSCILVFTFTACLTAAYAQDNSLITERTNQKASEPLSNPFPFDESKLPGSDGKNTYNIDPEHTSIGFRVKHMGIAWVSGRFRDFYGTFDYNPHNIKDSKTNVAIRSNSIDTASLKRDKHLKSSDFLDHLNFKKIFFISNTVQPVDENHFKLKGVLTIKDIQREVTLDVQNLGMVTDPWGNQRAGFTATTTINRKNFNLTWNRVLEAGALLIGDEVEISISVEGVLQKDLTPKMKDPTVFKLQKEKNDQ